jgi:hypothetical protein
MKENCTSKLLPVSKFIQYVVVFAFITSFFAVRSTAQINEYVFTQSQQTYVPLVSPTVLGTATSATTSPNAAAALTNTIYTLGAGTIPFNFIFDKVTYTGLFVSTNGYITFGAAPSATNVGPISSTATYAGAAVAFSRALAGIYNSAGDPGNGELSYKIVGVSPNREFVIQWKNFRSNITAAMNLPLNFQIRLQETTNRVRIVYNFSSGLSSMTGQVGLRGASNAFPANVSNRSVVSGTSTWPTSVAGTANTTTCAITSTLFPASGLTYDWVISCNAPEQLGFTASTTSSSTLFWKGFGGPYEVEYGASGFTPGNGTIVNTPDTFLVINGLAAASSYTFYVRSNCTASGNGYSARRIAPFQTGSAGEDCASAPLVSVSSSFAASTPINVTTGVSPNGPFAVLCGDGTSKIAGNDRWFKFVAPAGNQRISFRTAAGTLNDWVMEVWNGCPGSAGNFAIACNDDSGLVTTMPYIGLCQNEYVAGNTYYVRMWTYNSTLSGTMSIRIYQDDQCAIPPVNDDCVDAIAVPVNPPLSCPGTLQTFTTQFATVSGSPTMSCDGSALNDVWLSFNTGNFGAIRFNIAPISAIGLRAGIVFDCSDQTVVSCWNPANGAYVVSGLNPSAEYMLRVWSPAGQSGTFSVCIEDVCDDATATISGNAAICDGGSAQMRVDFTGTPPWNFTWSNGSSSQSVTTSTNPYFFTVSPTVSSNYSLTAFSTAICQGSFSGTGSVAVFPPPTVTLSPLPAVCSNVTYTFTEGSPSGGVYSGPGAIGNTFNASQLGAGTYTITYTFGNGSGCSRSASRSIVVIAAPSISNFAPTIAPIGSTVSIYGSNFLSTSQVRFNGTLVTSMSLVSSSQLNVIVPAGTTSGKITVTNPNGCSTISSANFGVGSTPLIISLNLKVFLQGFYTGGGLMNPVIDPGNPSVCDSIRVELRPSTDISQSPYPRIGLLSTTGQFSATYTNTIGNASYYIVVKHRNSIETWSKNPVYFPVGGIVNYDFTVATP